MTTQAPFKKDLYQYLVQNGYSHIQNVGTSETGEDDSKDVSDYLLIALKQNDPLITSEDTELWIEEISSTDVKEMLDGEDGINFIVEIPENEYQKFKSQQN